MDQLETLRLILTKLTGSTSFVSISHNINAVPGALSLTSTIASIRHDITILTNPYNLIFNGLTASVQSGGIVPIKSSKDIVMTLYNSNIVMTNHKGNINMDATGDNVGLSQ